MLLKRIILSDLIGTVLSSSLTVYLYWFAYHHFSDQTMIALLGFGQLSGIFLSTLGGGLADRLNKLYFIQLLKGAKFLLILLACLFQGVVDLQFLLPVFMFGSTVIGSFLSPSLESLLPFLVDRDEDLFRLNSVVTSLTQLAGIGAVILSAVYVSFFSFSAVLWLSALLAFLSFAFLLGLQVVTPLRQTSVFENIREGVAYLFQTAAIRNLIPVALLMNFSFWSIFLLLPKLTQDHFSFLPISYSVLEACFALGGIVGGWVFTRYFSAYEDKYRLFERTLVLQSRTLLVLGGVLLLPTKGLSYGLLLILWFAYALLNTVFSILYFGTLQLKVPREIMGSVFGALLTIFSLVNPLAALLSGFLVALLPIPYLVLLLAVIMVLAAVSVRFIPHIRTTFENEYD